VSIVCVDNLVFVKRLKLLKIFTCLCMLEVGVLCYCLASVVIVSDSLYSVSDIVKVSVIIY